jgi:microcystin degradation protein MlrC
MKRVRLATLGLSHETNTFARLPATYERFVEAGILRGDEIRRDYAESHATLAGFLEVGRQPDVEVVPLLFAMTNPIGTITSDAFERIVGEMLDLLRQHGPWDGVLLANHGAAVSEAYPDADGEITARVRALVGPDVPIGLSPDMHANISQKMVDNATVTVVYRTNPHLDPRPRARECAELIVRTIRGEIHPVQALELPPVAINIVKQFTGEEPMLGLVQDVEAVLARPGMLSASVAEGYPYADVAEMGMSFLAVHDGDTAAARDAARWMARRAWDRRAEFLGDTPSPEAALRAAAAAMRGPVVLMDVGDNIGGGSPGDSTVLLEAAQRLGIRRFLQTLCDPQAVAACVSAGVGQTVELQVGAKTDDQHGRPVAVKGRVRVISDGLFEEPTPTHGGFRFFDGGTTVVLETTDEHTLVLTSRLVGNTSIQQMYSVGVRPESFQVVVAKGVVSPRPAYAPIAAEIVLVNTPGVTTSDLSRFNYARRRRPLYPFETDATYEEVQVARASHSDES